MTLDLKLTEAEARTILRAHNIARNETTRGEVDGRVIERICGTWPMLRAEYQLPSVHTPEATHWVRTEQVSQLATHDWVLAIEKAGDSDAADLYAAPEIHGVPMDRPFATAMAVGHTLIVLVPRCVPDALRDACHTELEASELAHRKLDDTALQGALGVVMNHWHGMIERGECWFDELQRVWVMG